MPFNMKRENRFYYYPDLWNEYLRIKSGKVYIKPIDKYYLNNNNCKHNKLINEENYRKNEDKYDIQKELDELIDKVADRIANRIIKKLKLEVNK